ncbi:MAG: M20/M25/M40 family metallo-hydrolase [Phycisphaerae bacterium]|nr:M20/M25/M40 family metallo-hydrolase [Phycisphaerae bacterium]
MQRTPSVSVKDTMPNPSSRIARLVTPTLLFVLASTTLGLVACKNQQSGQAAAQPVAASAKAGATAAAAPATTSQPVARAVPATPAATVAIALPPGAPAGSAAPGSFAVINGKDAPIPQVKLGDPRIVAKIIDEGRSRNQVMKHLEHLTKKIGPRLTGSTNLRTANEWCRDQHASWGLANAHIEQWGTVGMGFDRGPSTGKVLVKQETRPRRGEDGAGEVKIDYVTSRDLELSTLSWSSGTNGPVRGRILKAPYDQASYDAVKDDLKGAWLLLRPTTERGMRDVRGRVSTWYTQFRKAREQVAGGEAASTIDLPARTIFDGVAGFIMASRDERVWTGAVNGWRELTPEKVDPEVIVSVRSGDYDHINSRLADGVEVWAEFDIKSTFVPGPVPVYNTIAEIPGTTWPDQVVIISGHLDSWDGPGSEGCTDNGTGSAVTLEAARILATVLKDAPPEARPKRTIRFIHWTGEEQGLLGSAAYVKANESNWGNISAAFVDDGGTNTQGGLPCADVQVDMLAAATAPINNVFFCPVDQKFLNVNIHSTGPQVRMGGGSDHMSFQRVGIPGFFWDEIGRADYGYGWHTQNDKLDLAIPVYLHQSSTNSALVAYQLACADTLLPRPPKPQRQEGEGEPGQARPRAPREGDRPARDRGAAPDASAPTPAAAGAAPGGQ